MNSLFLFFTQSAFTCNIFFKDFSFEVVSSVGLPLGIHCLAFSFSVVSAVNSGSRVRLFTDHQYCFCATWKLPVDPSPYPPFYFSFIISFVAYVIPLVSLWFQKYFLQFLTFRKIFKRMLCWCVLTVCISLSSGGCVSCVPPNTETHSLASNVKCENSGLNMWPF